MKKVLTAMLLVAILLGCASCVNAATEDDLLAAVTKTYTIAGEPVKIKDGDLTKVERYLSQYDISPENCDGIIEKINKAVDKLNDAGTLEVSELDQGVKDELVTLANEAARLAGATLTYDATTRTVSVYRGGQFFDSTSLESYLKFTQSGNNYMAYVVASVVAIIAIATVVYVKKVRANA